MIASNPQLASVERASESSPPQASTMTELVSGIFDDAQTLVRQQIDMLRAEFREDIVRTKRALELGSIGLVMMTIGGLCLVAFLVNVISDQFAISMWASCLIVGASLLVAGLGFVVAARSSFKTFSPLPDKSINAIRENLTWKTQPQS